VKVVCESLRVARSHMNQRRRRQLPTELLTLSVLEPKPAKRKMYLCVLNRPVRRSPLHVCRADHLTDQRPHQHRTPPLEALDQQRGIGARAGSSAGRNFQVMPMQAHRLDLHLLDGVADFFWRHSPMVTKALADASSKLTYIRHYIRPKRKKPRYLFDSAVFLFGLVGREGLEPATKGL